jgi:Kip1 ubiquitination-promoting complex protein 1
LDIESITPFSSIRANTAVFSGRYYYEARLMTSGLVQLGWCTLATPFGPEYGVGDDETSYAYDGLRIKKWNSAS